MSRAQRRALLFDMDGVVVHNMPAHTEAWRLFFLDHGIRLPIAEFLAKTSGMPTRDVLAYFLKRRVPKKEADFLAAQKELLYRSLYRDKRKPARGLPAFIRQAKLLGFKLGLGTGSKDDNVRFILDGLNLRRHFDAVVTGGDVRRGKPHPETFLTLARRLRARPCDCLVFEDALLGEEAAVRAGMRVVALTTSHHAREFRRSIAAVPDFTRLSARGLLKRLS
jgi:beta-phosphoglucomutase family hydrolase